jgi:Dolichyl-phosphate-mannose-protein mannosyltransferase
VTRSRHRLGASLALALLLFAVLLAINLSYGIGNTDDAWSLLVLDRVGSGDVLYRDVWFGTTPLPVWIGAGATKLLGTELVVLKGLVALCMTATALLSARIAGQLGVGRAGRVLVAAASIAYANYSAPNLYTPLAYVLLLASMSAVLAWRGRLERGSEPGGEPSLLVIAGAAAGLSAASKQNVGLLAIAATALSVALLSPPRAIALRSRAAEIAVVLGSATVAAAITLIPVAIQGALGDLITFGFHKGAYVKHSSVPYSTGFDAMVDLAGRPFSQPGVLARYVAYFIPPLSALALLAIAVRSPSRLTATLALFVGASIGGIFPLANYGHVSAAVPICAVAIAWSMKELTPRLAEPGRRAGLAVASGFVALAAGAALVGHPARALRAGDAPANLPHFHGPLVSSRFSDHATDLATELREADGGQNRTFLLMRGAAFYYLVAGLSDPTRYDYPTVTPFGASGQDEVIEAIRRGAVHRVCVSSFAPKLRTGAEGGEPSTQVRGGQRPAQLVRYVRTRMDRVRTLGSPHVSFAHCTLYRRGERATAGPPPHPAGGP